MAAILDSIHRHLLPIALIGVLTGLLALIPKVGWLLGFAAFILASKYIGRQTLFLDLLVTVLIWVAIQVGAARLFLPV